MPRILEGETTEPTEWTDPERCKVVGIGASAGGLEALERFFEGVSPSTSMAFVVVQHLDPTQKGMMVELLERSCPLPVNQITDAMAVEPGQVYVIPPNRDLSILNGVLYLLEPTTQRGLRLPIDFFLESLALDKKQDGVGVILSGMGSDGTLGLGAIKDHGGGTFVQSPASAKFNGMPQSAIDAGVAEVVASVEELARAIGAYKARSDWSDDPFETDLSGADHTDLEKIVAVLRTQTGHDFSHYKTTTIYRRIERRMSLHQLQTISDYLRYLRENPDETELLFKELLIGVTSFFRDPALWAQLKEEIFPALMAANPHGGVLRAWVPACSTGEEAFSLAIVFLEALEEVKPTSHYTLQVFATDLDRDAIDQARLGSYRSLVVDDVSEERLKRFFSPTESGYQIASEIRGMVTFAPHNLLMDPPFIKLDLISCRNLLIYLDTHVQKQLIPLFHHCLNATGALVLGTAETIGSDTALFTPLPGKHRTYWRTNPSPEVGPFEFPSSSAAQLPRRVVADRSPSKSMSPSPSLESVVDSLLLRNYSPAAVVCTAEGDLIYVSGKTGNYLEPAAGKATLNLFAMARDGLGGVLAEAIARVVRTQTIVVMNPLAVGTGGNHANVNITAQPISEAGTAGLVLVVFSEAPKRPAASAEPGADEHVEQVASLVDEIQRSRDELQTTREEMRTSQEELMSMNEELQSTNEELQSTNEELTTSKEEMQSMNEELQTVNDELGSKVTELSEASDDMKNLLDSTEVATVFLDKDLAVRRFTPEASNVIKLIPGDAGRPVTDLATTLDYPELADDARAVLRTLVFREVDKPTAHGRWYKIRIMPYRTQTDRIDGVVITFRDITASKTLEATLRETHSVLRSRLSDQATELDAAKSLEDVMRKAQSVLEERLDARGSEPGPPPDDDASHTRGAQ